MNDSGTPGNFLPHTIVLCRMTAKRARVHAHNIICSIMNEEGAQKKKILEAMTVNEANVAFKLFFQIFLPSLKIFLSEIEPFLRSLPFYTNYSTWTRCYGNYHKIKITRS